MEYTAKDYLLLEELHTIALDLSPVAGSRVAAGVREGNHWISFGVNQKKTHPLQAQFSTSPFNIYLHAEIAAIANAQKRIAYRDEMERCSIYIARAKIVGGRWVYGIAKPCEGCQRAIERMGFKRVIYSLETT